MRRHFEVVFDAIKNTLTNLLADLSTQAERPCIKSRCGSYFKQ